MFDLIAAAVPAPVAEKGMPISLFDLVVAAVAVIGLLRGRKRGMSQDLLDLLMWIGIVAGGTFAHQPGGDLLAAKVPGMSLTMARILAYLAVALVCFIIKSLVANALKDKLAGSDIFGRAEYPLGMISGLIRFECMLLMGVALINTCETSTEERAEAEKKQKAELGSSFFPSLGEIHYGIFEGSFCGKFVKKKMDRLLVHKVAPPPTAEPAKPGKETIKDKKAKEMDIK
jgi:uncharacterized membrane protein required for colicin V production